MSRKSWPHSLQVRTCNPYSSVDNDPISQMYALPLALAVGQGVAFANYYHYGLRRKWCRTLLAYGVQVDGLQAGEFYSLFFAESSLRHIFLRINPGNMEMNFIHSLFQSIWLYSVLPVTLTVVGNWLQGVNLLKIPR